MEAIKVHYLWLDADDNIRSKVRIQNGIRFPNDNTETLEGVQVSSSPKYYPNWAFDGSSTGQATTEDSDITLVPVRVYSKRFMFNLGTKPEVFLLCDACKRNNEGELAPIKGQHRKVLNVLVEKYKDNRWTFGVEQEFFLFNQYGSRPHGWPERGFPEDQGKYYCGVGSDQTYGSEIIEEFTDEMLAFKLPLCGTNAEVAPAQWEYQIGPGIDRDKNLIIKDPLELADALIFSRYLLFKIAERHKLSVKLDPKLNTKQYGKKWNGSGLHTNFSNENMRTDTTGVSINNALTHLKGTHDECIKRYGKGNEERLVGSLETSSMDKFTSGESHRECSVRVPLQVQETGCGYLEDRRPCANGNPYLIMAAIIQSVEEGVCTV